MDRKNQIIGIFLVSVMILVVLTGCSQSNVDDKNTDDKNTDGKSTDDNVGIANPASKFCADNGGTLEFMTAPDGGQYGICRFSDGKQCEEWAYFRGECTKNQCDGCPNLMPPGPNFCTNGTIVQGSINECGCIGAPRCESGVRGCTKELRRCPDGTAMGRNFSNSCRFDVCPDGTDINDDNAEDNTKENIENNAGNSTSGKKVTVQCTPEQKKAEICTMEYMPVCGWYNSSVKCIKYPCAIDAGNACQACADPNVEYYTEGTCPTENSDVAV